MLYHGNLRVCQPETLTTPTTTGNSLSPSINGTKVQIFVYYLQESA